MSITLVDGVTKGLAGISGSLLTANKHTEQFQARLAKMQTQLIGLQALGGIGSNIFRGSFGFMDHAIDASKEYVYVLNQMKMRGLDNIEIQKSIAAAAATSSKVLTSSYASNLKVMLDFATVLGETPAQLEEGRKLTPTFQKMTNILRASADSPEAAANAEKQSYSALKAIEMRGQIRSAEQIKQQVYQMASVMSATSGRVVPSDYQALNKFARQAKLSLSDRFLYDVAPELILENKTSGGGAGGSGGPGTMIAAFFKTARQGIMSTVTAQNLAKIGLLDHPVLKTTTTGTMVKGGSGVVGSELAASDPDLWVQQYLAPALHKAYPGLTDLQIGKNIIPTLFKGDRMTTSLIGELWNKEAQFKKFAANRAKQPGFEELNNKAMDAPNNAELAAQIQFKNSMTIIGNQVLPKLVPLMVQFTDGLNKVATYLGDHPAVANMIAIGAAVGVVGGGLLAIGAQVGTLILVGGALGITADGLAALLLPLLAVSAGITLAFAAANDLDGTLNALAGSLQNAGNAVIGLINGLGGAVGIHIPNLSFANGHGDPTKLFFTPPPLSAHAAGGDLSALRVRPLPSGPKTVHNTVNFNIAKQEFHHEPHESDRAFAERIGKALQHHSGKAFGSFFPGTSSVATVSPFSYGGHAGNE